MADAKVTLKAAFGSYGLTAPLVDGRVALHGVELDHVAVSPVTAIFRRMCRAMEFDLCELALTTYMTAKAYNKPLIAIPVFPFRQFHHSHVAVSRHSNIRHPKDLEGKRVGVRAYTVTTGVWVRGILASEYGLNLDKVTWIVVDEEHVAEYQLPGNVIRDLGRDLSEMLAADEIDAAIGLPQPLSPEFVPLIADALATEYDWYRRTALYPINHTIAIKTAVLEAHPWLAGELVRGFAEARRVFLETVDDEPSPSAELAEMRATKEFLGDEFMRYGLDENRETLMALIEMAAKQRILPRAYALHELFVDPAAQVGT